MNIGVIVLALLTLGGTISWLGWTGSQYVADQTAFRKFMQDYSKIYANDEQYNLRFSNFRNNLKRNAELAQKHPLATFGINKFSDLSPQEFKETHLMKSFNADDSCIWPYNRIAKSLKGVKIPTTFDWRTKGAVTAVKNQASCGSCWTFSTAENIEGVWFLAGKGLVSLSEQWIVDCSKSCLQSEPDLCNGGCNGGLPWLAYEDIINNHGLTSETQYPYTGEDGTCETTHSSVAKIGNWTSFSTDPTDIITQMVTVGPLSITLNAGLLMSYTGGIITGTPDDCPNSGSDHAVLLVGYDNTAQPYWIVKNSWGTDWGESGYFRIESDNGLCGINACVTSAKMS
jgi:cathepsin F